MSCAVTVHAESKSDCVSDAAIPASTPDEQLVDNGDGTVTDNKTGLMWKKCLEGLSDLDCKNGSLKLFTWQQALKQPGEVNREGFPANFKDWRLPTLTELRSLVEVRCYHPAINQNRFPNTPSSSVWSITPYADATDSVWVVNFHYGLPFYNHCNYSLPVRLVRTPLALAMPPVPAM
jgi:hypothetical protein